MGVGSEMDVLAKRAAAKPGSVSWADIHAGLARAGRRMGEWAGLPMPIQGTRLIVHKSYPFSESMGKTFMPEASLRTCRNSDVCEEVVLRNSWASYRDGKQVQIWQEGKSFFFTYGERQHAGSMILQTLGAARAWDFDAEMRAQETLKRHLTEWAFQCYLMTGMFLESSKRSGVFYLFRRLRPTVALTGNKDRKGRDVGMRILACLCLHPIGWYDNSFAGALVPTDDVIAHLLLMRSDEHKYWAHANQHHPLAAESGL